MSDTSIPQGATLPQHPLLSNLGLDSPVGARETLDFCADHLQLLADLFGGDNERYPTLDSDSTRLAMWRQLMGTAAMLEAVSGELALKAADARAEREIERAAKERAANDPELSAKAAVLGKTFAEMCRQTFPEAYRETAIQPAN